MIWSQTWRWKLGSKPTMWYGHLGGPAGGVVRLPLTQPPTSSSQGAFDWNQKMLRCFKTDWFQHGRMRPMTDNCSISRNFPVLTWAEQSCWCLWAGSGWCLQPAVQLPSLAGVEQSPSSEEAACNQQKWKLDFHFFSKTPPWLAPLCPRVQAVERLFSSLINP